MGLALALALGCAQDGAGPGVTLQLQGVPDGSRSLRVLGTMDQTQVRREFLAGLPSLRLDLPGLVNGKLTLEVAARDDSCVLATGTVEVMVQNGQGSAQLSLTRLGKRQCSVNLQKTAGGTVLSQPYGMSCGPQCASAFADFDEGKPVKLVARPAPGYQFAGWSGSCGGMGCCPVRLNSSADVAAAFVPIQAQANSTPGVRPTSGGDCPSDGNASFGGVKTDVPMGSLTGWSLCYQDTYADSGVSLNGILAACTKNRLLLGCREVGSNTLIVAANAPRTDVLFDTGPTYSGTHSANGVAWYYNNSWSWGFAPDGDQVGRNSCDVIGAWTPGPDGDKRLCWHTAGGTLNTGWRCGSFFGLNWNDNYERIVMQAD